MLVAYTKFVIIKDNYNLTIIYQSSSINYCVSNTNNSLVNSFHSLLNSIGRETPQSEKIIVLTEFILLPQNFILTNIIFPVLAPNENFSLTLQILCELVIG